MASGCLESTSGRTIHGPARVGCNFPWDRKICCSGTRFWVFGPVWGSLCRESAGVVAVLGLPVLKR